MKAVFVLAIAIVALVSAAVLPEPEQPKEEIKYRTVLLPIRMTEDEYAAAYSAGGSGDGDEKSNAEGTDDRSKRTTVPFFCETACADRRRICYTECPKWFSNLTKGYQYAQFGVSPWQWEDNNNRAVYNYTYYSDLKGTFSNKGKDGSG